MRHSSRSRSAGIVLGAALVLATCDDPARPPLPGGIALEEVASGLGFLTFLTAPANDDRLFVIEKAGRIRIIDDGVVLPTPFLDIASLVSTGSEQGLLGMAFHPDYATNGRFYVSYTNTGGDTRIDRYTVSADRNVANAASQTLILAEDQPFENHNGGMIAFGPDGMLYIGLGDGGSGGDPLGHAQDRSTILGDLLRIDVDGGSPYAIPPDNPFADDAGVRPEIWASGLRNPWRFSFDRNGSTLYIADVGQGAREEVNAVPANRPGVNYGWDIMEGMQCFGTATCNTSGLTAPALDYPNTGSDCAVTGGYVYRGTAIPGLVGHYLYSDFCGGWLRSFRLAGDAATEHREWDVPRPGSVSSFGEDADGELYVLVAGGSVYRIVPVPD